MLLCPTVVHRLSLHPTVLVIMMVLTAFTVSCFHALLLHEGDAAFHSKSILPTFLSLHKKKLRLSCVDYLVRSHRRELRTATSNSKYIIPILIPPYPEQAWCGWSGPGVSIFEHRDPFHPFLCQSAGQYGCFSTRL